jgi:hypothetical protein
MENEIEEIARLHQEVLRECSKELGKPMSEDELNDFLEFVLAWAESKNSTKH